MVEYWTYDEKNSGSNPTGRFIYLFPLVNNFVKPMNNKLMQGPFYSNGHPSRFMGGLYLNAPKFWDGFLSKRLLGRCCSNHWTVPDRTPKASPRTQYNRGNDTTPKVDWKEGRGGRCFGNGLSMLKPLTPMGDRVREMRGGVLPHLPNPGFSFSSFLMEWGKKGSREDWFRIKNVSRKIRKKDFFRCGGRKGINKNTTICQMQSSK